MFDIQNYYNMATPQSRCDCTYLHYPIRLELAHDLFLCEFDDVHRKEINA